MQNDSLTDIIEVQTTNAPTANKYLNNGYLLLGIYPISTQRQDNSGNSYVQQGVSFVVGRTDDVKHYDLPPGQNYRNNVKESNGG